MASGAVLTKDDIEIKMPALGIRARYLDAVVDCRLSKDVDAGAPVLWEDLDNVIA